MLSRLSLKTGNREYSCSRNSARRSPIVAASADRDDVGPRRHHLADQRVAEVDDALQQPPLFALDEPFLLARCRGRPSPPRWPPRRLRPASSRLRRPLRHRPARDPARDRPERAGDRAERRQQQLEHPLGIAADDQQRQQQLDRSTTNAATPITMNATSRRAVDADRLGQQRRRRGRDQPEQQPDRDEQQDRIVEIGAERRPGRSLRSATQPQRQPHQRAERRLDGAEVDRGARRAGRRSSGIIARSISAFAQAALAPEPPLQRAPSRRRRARDRSPAGAAGRAAPALAARSRSAWPAARACRRATPRAMTMSPRMGAARLGTGRWQRLDFAARKDSARRSRSRMPR